MSDMDESLERLRVQRDAAERQALTFFDQAQDMAGLVGQVRAENARLRGFAEWIVSLDDSPGRIERQTITLNHIVTKAREALGR